jgi:pSer/pThr/pTyr-binding forkhead associated (FHA) protein
MPKLLGPGAANGVEIPLGGLIVGRERGCDIVLRSKNVSRNHARLTIRDKIPRVEDLGSSNGTKVNGVPINGITELHAGDSITFGDMTLQFVEELPSAVKSGATAPAAPALTVTPELPDFDRPSSRADSRHESRWNEDQRSSPLNVSQSPTQNVIDGVGQTHLMRPPARHERIVEPPSRPAGETGITGENNDQAKSKSNVKVPVHRRTFALEA